jgi:hypothetical protein
MPFPSPFIPFSIFPFLFSQFYISFILVYFLIVYSVSHSLSSSFPYSSSEGRETIVTRLGVLRRRNCIQFPAGPRILSCIIRIPVLGPNFR